MIYKDYKNISRQLGCCVVSPAFNCENSIEDILYRILKFSDNIIVINDGSTDKTQEKLNRFENIIVYNFKKNCGKGAALRKGFEIALESGFQYAITIDSDGQHQPEDIPLFIDLLQSHPDSIIVGARNMNQDGVPRKSSFGHNFSNFWYKVETGIKLPDTQSGFRLYPLKRINELSLRTNRFEFEIEVLVKAAWKGIEVLSVPVRVLYRPKNERVSHFRPVIDFTRISILNTLLCFAAFFYIKPRDISREFKAKSIKNFVKENLLGSSDSNLKLALSVFVGIFMGIVPIWGWQLAAAIALAYIFKLNRFVVITTANISIPPMIPIILYLSYLTGGIVLGRNYFIKYSYGINFEVIKSDLYQYVIGSIVFGAVLATMLAIMTYLFLVIFRKSTF